jgi:hypothetical protein
MGTSSGFDTALLQYGAVGVVAMLCIVAVRVLFKREEAAYDREKDRADRLEAELLKLNTAIQERYLTALNEATRAIGEALTTMRRR